MRDETAQPNHPKRPGSSPGSATEEHVMRRTKAQRERLRKIREAMALAKPVVAASWADVKPIRLRDIHMVRYHGRKLSAPITGESR